MKDFLTPQLEQIINHFGKDAQILKCVEELNECAAEIMKSYSGRANSVHQEIADAIIMLEQARLIFGAELVDESIEFKLNRMMRRIEDETQRHD